MTAVRVVDDPAELRRFYADRPEAHLYALADLEEPYWSASTWYRRGDAVVGVVGLPDPGSTTIYAVSTRAPDATLQLLTELAHHLESGVLITAPLGLGRALEAIGPVAWHRRYRRFVLESVEGLPDVADIDEPIVPLGTDDRAEIETLYATDPGAAFFLPNMLEDDSFVGIREGGELVAVAGTHVLSETQRLAAIGGVLTKPTHRGRGFGRAVSAAVIERIRPRVDLIGLNTAIRNAAALRVYESLGFVPVLDYEEAEPAQAA